MKFSVFVAPKAVKSDLAATTKEEVIAELVQSSLKEGLMLTGLR